MSDAASAFWNDVKSERDIAFVALTNGSFTEQPRGQRLDKMACIQKGVQSGYYVGACYITSLKNRQLNLEAGGCSEVTLNLAGQRIAEGGHRLSTDEEIRAFKKAGQDRKEELARLEINRQAVNRHQVIVNG